MLVAMASHCVHRERIEAGIPDNTVSLWSYILSRPAEFTNPGYIRPPGRLGPDNPSMDPMVMVRHVIKPTAALSEMKVWRFYVQLWDGVL